MQTLFNFATLLPVLLLILQAYFILFLSINVLKKLRLIKTPYAGMEYSHMIVACAIIFAAFLISTSNSTNLFQSFKTYQNQGVDIIQNTFIKFSQFFLVILFFEVLLGIIIYTVMKLFLGFKNSVKQLEDNNLPLSILLSLIIICFGVVLNHAANEIMDYITPRILSFR